jgi:hypothetical protein
MAEVARERGTHPGARARRATSTCVCPVAPPISSSHAPSSPRTLVLPTTTTPASFLLISLLEPCRQLTSLARAPTLVRLPVFSLSIVPFLWATTFARRCALGGRREGGAGSSLARAPLATCVPTPYRGGFAPVRAPSARPLARRPRVRVCVSCVVRYRCILSDSLMLSCSLVLVPHRWSSVYLRTSPMARHHHSTLPPPASRSRLHPPAQPLSGSTDFGIQFI